MRFFYERLTKDHCKEVPDLKTSSTSLPDISHLELDLKDPELTEPAQDSRIPFETIQVLNLMGCNISTLQAVENLLKKCKNLKALWLKKNPIMEDEATVTKIRAYIEAYFKKIELFNGKFTKNCGPFGLMFVSLDCQLRNVMSMDSNELSRLVFTDRDVFRIADLPDKIRAFSNIKSIVAMNTYFDKTSHAQMFFDMIKNLPELEDLWVEYYMLDMFWKIKERMRFLCPKIKRINGCDLELEMPTEEEHKIDRIVENVWPKMEWFSYKVPDNDVTVYNTSGDQASGRVLIF